MTTVKCSGCRKLAAASMHSHSYRRQTSDAASSSKPTFAFPITVIHGVNSEILLCARRIIPCNSLTRNPLREYQRFALAFITAKNSVTGHFHPLVDGSHSEARLSALQPMLQKNASSQNNICLFSKSFVPRNLRVEFGTTEPRRGTPRKQYSFKKDVSGNPGRGPQIYPAQSKPRLLIASH